MSLDTDPFAIACRAFASELARLGIDPHRATVVLDPEDRRVLSDHASRLFGYGYEEAYMGTVKVEGLTFLEWRQPAR